MNQAAKEIPGSIGRRESLFKAAADASQFILTSALGTAIGFSAFSKMFETDGKPKNLMYGSHENLEVGGRKISLVGVSHDIDTFLGHRDDIEERVLKAPFVVLEYFYADQRKMATEEFGEISTSSLSDRIDGFFAGIGSVCAKYKKDVIVVNPENGLVQIEELFLLMGLPSGLLLSDAECMVRKILKFKSNRRNFLSNTFYGFAGLEYWSWYDTIRNAMHNTKEDFEPNPLRFNEIDFRDVESTIRLQKIIEINSDEISDDQIIPVFQGSVHADGVKKYIKNPTLAKLKDHLYPHYKIFKSPVKRYHYDSEKKLWVDF